MNTIKRLLFSAVVAFLVTLAVLFLYPVAGILLLLIQSKGGAVYPLETAILTVGIYVGVVRLLKDFDAE